MALTNTNNIDKCRNEYYFNGNDSSSNLGIRISDIKNHFIIVTTDLNHIYTASTIVSTTTTVISPIAEAAAKASWNKPDINDHLSADERKDMEKCEWLTKRPVGIIFP
ncbi:unnamed protein product [Rhizophagus irregularis]|nr:unnamed protein product [Rhizophagus irregularis]